MKNASGSSANSIQQSTEDPPSPDPDRLSGPVRYGFTEAVALRFAAHPVDGGEVPARVVRADRNRVVAATADGLMHLPYPPAGRHPAAGSAAGGAHAAASSHPPAGRHPAAAPAPPAVPTAGDWVWLGQNRAGEPAVVGVLPRASELSRKRAYEASSEAQVLAANIDVVGVVVPVDRPLTHNRLERTLVAAWDSGATPLVIITKADLADIADDVVGKVILQAAGVDVVTTSAEQGDGLDELLMHVLPGRTLVLLGPSGAGKSTLINALAGYDVQSTGTVRAADGRGRHTTTSRELVPLLNGAVLMDTPGVRGFGLFDADDGMGEMFGDLEELFGKCRFSDCAHDKEPGCAVRAALEDESLDTRRWASYLKLQRELAALNRRHDAAARRAYQREWHQKVAVAGRSQRAAERYGKR